MPESFRERLLYWAADISWVWAAPAHSSQASSMFRMISLQTAHIPKRTLGSNLEGFLCALRIHNIDSYLWQSLFAWSSSRTRRELEHLHTSAEECPGNALSSVSTSGLGQQRKVRWGWPAGAPGCCRCVQSMLLGSFLRTAQPSLLSIPLHFATTAWSAILETGLQIFIGQLLDWCHYGGIMFPRMFRTLLVFRGRSRWEFPFYRSERQHWGDGNKDIRPFFQADPAKYSSSSSGRAIAFENAKMKS